MDEARVAVERGLGDGSLVRGVTVRKAEGAGLAPPQGALLLPDEVERVWPAVRGREVLGYLVVGRGETWSAATTRWRVPVVAVGRA